MVEFEIGVCLVGAFLYTGTPIKKIVAHTSLAKRKQPSVNNGLMLVQIVMRHGVSCTGRKRYPNKLVLGFRPKI
jgi:hypothetical protein